MKRRSEIVLTLVMVLLTNLAVFAPRLAFSNPSPGGVLDSPPTRASVPGICFELGLVLCVLALTAGTRWRGLVRALAVLLYATFLIFSAYHEAFMRLVFFTPTVVDDWRLLLNLMHFLRAATFGFLLTLVPWVLGYLLVVVLAGWTFKRVQTWAQGVSLRTRALSTLGFAVVGSAAVIWRPTNAVIQPLSDSVFANIRASRITLAKWRTIFSSPPDTRYDHFASVPLARRPNVYLLMIEAYGEVLANCNSNHAYQSLLARISQRLDATGYHARSGYSTAPIYAARSWLSMATVQTGIHIDSQPEFRVLEQSMPRVPTLTSFFKAHGYHTMMLQPLDAHRFGVSHEDMYRRDRQVIRADLPYQGPKAGLAGVPDQYSLGYFQDHFLSTAPQPRFVFYMAVSTHYNYWDPGPFVRDYRKLDGPVAPEDIVPWSMLDGRLEITSIPLANYLQTVEYEWRVLADFIDARKDEDALIIVVGDHQPRMECPGNESYNSPIHVISRDPKLVDLFADVGLIPGLYVPPGQRPPLKHEGLHSLLVSKLTSIDRKPGTPAVEYLPDGLPLNALHRR